MFKSTLVDTEHSAEFNNYVDEAGIRHIRILVPAHKTPAVIIPIKTIIDIQKIMLDPTYHPMLVHCNKGKVRLSPLPSTEKQKPSTTNPSHSIEQAAWSPATANSKAGQCPPSSRSMYFTFPPPTALYHTKPTHFYLIRYRKYAGAKFRPLDEAYMTTFNADVCRKILRGNNNVAYFPLAAQTMLPTPPASEKSVDGDGDVEADQNQAWGIGQILTL